MIKIRPEGTREDLVGILREIAKIVAMVCATILLVVLIIFGSIEQFILVAALALVCIMAKGV